MRALSSLLLLAACAAPPSECNGEWLQWGGGVAHEGDVCAQGQPLERELYHAAFDPFVAQELADHQDLGVHYQAPLVDGDDAYMEVKTGFYPTAEVWQERKLHWEGDQLIVDWSVSSDWTPAPIPSGVEEMFQPAIAGDVLWLPARGGSVLAIDRGSGATIARVSPFDNSVADDTYVAGGLAADAEGNIYYQAIHVAPNEWSHGWLVKVSRDLSWRAVSFDVLAPADAPKPESRCTVEYDPMDPLSPQPPRPAPTTFCGPQRPSLNVTPAIGPDGMIYTVSRADGSDAYSYLLAITPELTQHWGRTLRGILRDGCGVGANVIGCAPSQNHGVDPATGEQPAGRVIDDSSSSPVVLPDGNILYGAYNAYDTWGGHLLEFDPSSAFVASFDFGWDTTPAVWRHDGTYSILLKDNVYGYGPYDLVQLDPKLRPEWRFRSTNDKSCTRDPVSGALSCVRDHPNGFEWCINAPVVDRDGTVYANSEDGNLYAIGQGGVEVGKFFLDMSVGAAYTPLALDGHGRVYALNDGSLSVVGR
jgi:outer membrane protein assembly factor BamB